MSFRRVRNSRYEFLNFFGIGYPDKFKQEEYTFREFSEKSDVDLKRLKISKIFRGIIKNSINYLESATLFEAYITGDSNPLNLIPVFEFARLFVHKCTDGIIEDHAYYIRNEVPNQHLSLDQIAKEVNSRTLGEQELEDMFRDLDDEDDNNYDDGFPKGPYPEDPYPED